MSRDHIKTEDELIAEELEMGMPTSQEVYEKEKAKIKSKKDDENILYTSYFENENYILEQIRNTTRPTHGTRSLLNYYIIFDKSSRLTEVKPELIVDNKTIRPIEDDLLTSGTILLPSGVEEYGDTASLVNEIRKFINKYCEVPTFFENFLPYLVLFYWVYEKFPFVPYAHFVGRTGTGKSTAMQIVGSISYKPIDASGAITMASIFRTAHKWHGTLLLDEFDSAGENYKEMLSLLKSGVENRAVLRTEGEGKLEVKAYLVKSPKMFTSENPINNAGLQSRTLVIKMEKNKRKIPLYRLNSFLVESERLRNKLLLWRLHHLNKIDLTEIEFGFEELKAFDRRVQQVITPVYYMADETARKEILKFAEEQEKETLRERREALDGQIFEIIYEDWKNKIYTALSKIAETLNKDSKYPITEKKIGNIVRKILGFDIQRLGADKISTVILDKEEDKIEELRIYYGLGGASVLRVPSAVSVADQAQKVFETENIPF